MIFLEIALYLLKITRFSVVFCFLYRLNDCLESLTALAQSSFHHGACLALLLLLLCVLGMDEFAAFFIVSINSLRVALIISGFVMLEQSMADNLLDISCSYFSQSAFWNFHFIGLSAAPMWLSDISRSKIWIGK